MKRTILILLSCTIVFSLFSCTKSKAPYIPNDDQDELNFYGESFVILKEWYTTGLNGKRGLNASTDRLLDRFEETEDKFNLIFVIESIDNIPTYMLGKSVAGNLHADLLELKNSSLFEAYNLEMILPVSDVISDVNDEKWGSVAYGNSTLFNGTRYGFFANMWDDAPELCGWLECNLDNFDKYNVTNPHEYLENGEWDWEHLKILLRQATVSDGDNSFVGLLYDGIYMGTEIIIPAILSNGGSPIKYVGGRYTNGFDAPEAIEAIEFTLELIEEGIAEIGPSGSAGDIWRDGRRWMVAYSFGTPQSTEWRLSPIKYPTGPNGDPNAVTAFINGRGTVWGFPIFSIYNEEDLYAVVNDLFAPLDSEYYPNGWKDYIEDTVIFEGDDYQYFLKAADEAFVYNTIVLDKSSTIIEDTFQSIIYQRISISSALESISEIFSEDIEELYNK